MFWRLKNIANKTLKETENKKDFSDFLIDSTELKQIQSLYIKSLILSGTVGAMAIFIYYVPLYFFPDFFSSLNMVIAFWGLSISLETLPQLYNFTLLLIELYLLGLIHIRAVRKLSILNNFPNPQSNDYAFHFAELIDLSLEKTKSNEKLIGLNPFYGLPKFYVVFILLFNKTKAFLSNVIIKVVVRKFLGRYVLRLYTDLLGAPIYFFWNAYATRLMFLKAKYYIFGQSMVYFCADYFSEKYKDNEEFKGQIYEILAQIAIYKRSFSKSHYFLSNKILAKFNINVRQDFTPNFTIKTILNEFPEEMATDLMTLFVVGMVIDGDLNRHERRQIEVISNSVTFKIPVVEKRQEFLQAFKKGYGVSFLNELIQSKQ